MNTVLVKPQVKQSFKIGCAVWAYQGWIGDFYPPGSRSSEFLSLYGDRFTTVEGNTTFYAIPDASTIARWKAQTPDNFEFCLKLPRELTHSGGLKPSIDGTLRFIELVEGLGEKLGCVFAQLPPSYGPENADDLTTFLEALPQETPFALEVRHPGWFEATPAAHLNALLQELGVGRVILDSRAVYSGDDDPQLESERRKPLVPVQPIVTANLAVVRFISHPTQSINQAFLEEWAIEIDRWLKAGTRVYFFVHCPIEDRSPHIAQQFQHLLEQQRVPVPPLPWDGLALPPLQLSLF